MAWYRSQHTDSGKIKVVLQVSIKLKFSRCQKSRAHQANSRNVIWPKGGNLNTNLIKFLEKFWGWVIGLPLFPSEAGLPPLRLLTSLFKRGGSICTPPPANSLCAKLAHCLLLCESKNFKFLVGLVCNKWVGGWVLFLQSLVTYILCKR